MKDRLLGILVLLVLSPLIVIFAPFLIAESLYSTLRKEPKPKIPKTVEIDDLSGSELADKCVDFVMSQLHDMHIEVKKTKNTYRLVSERSRGKLIIFYFDTFFDITITKLNTYEWYIDDNHQDIDLYLWIVIGVLRNGAVKTRSRLGRTNYWVWSKELRVWVVLQKEGSSYDGIQFYTEPPEYVKAKLPKSLKV